MALLKFPCIIFLSFLFFSLVKIKTSYQATTLRLIKAVTLNARVTLLCISRVDFRLAGMRSHFFEIVRPSSHLHNTTKVQQLAKATLEGIE